MAQCETCGNNYDKTFDIVLPGQKHTFDSFECAIDKLAPTCAHCTCRILDHGVEAGGQSIAALTALKNRSAPDPRSRLAIERLLRERIPQINPCKPNKDSLLRRIAELYQT